MAEIKCRKCKLTYDSKNPKCPYCKAAKPRPLLIAAIALLIGSILLIAFTEGRILNVFPSKTKFINGMLVQVENVSADGDFVSELLDIDEIDIDMSITNLTPTEKNLDFKIKAYTDEYEAAANWIFSEANVRVTKLLPRKKCIQTITVIPNTDDWDRLELYYSEGDSKYRKFCVIRRNEIQ